MTVIKIVIVMTLTTVRMLTGSSYYLLLIKGSRRLSAPLQVNIKKMVMKIISSLQVTVPLVCLPPSLTILANSLITCTVLEQLQLQNPNYSLALLQHPYKMESVTGKAGMSPNKNLIMTTISKLTPTKCNCQQKSYIRHSQMPTRSKCQKYSYKFPFKQSFL